MLVVFLELVVGFGLWMLMRVMWLLVVECDEEIMRIGGGEEWFI